MRPPSRALVVSVREDRRLAALAFLEGPPPDEWLTMAEVNWVLDQRGGQTLLIRRAGAASGAPTWRAPKFEIRSGTVVALAEMFYYGSEELCTAYDIYKLYMDLPIFIHKRQRCVSRRRLDE